MNLLEKAKDKAGSWQKLAEELEKFGYKTTKQELHRMSGDWPPPWKDLARAVFRFLYGRRAGRAIKDLEE